MSIIRSFGIIFCLCGLLCSEELKTIDGEVYQEFTVRKVEPCEIVILHSTGSATIRTGNLTDEFLELHEVPFEKCKDFELERTIALRARKFADFVASKKQIVLPDGVQADSSQITSYNPARVVFLLEGGPKGIDPAELPKFLQDAIDYSESAAVEFREYERSQELASARGLAKIRELRKAKALKQAEQQELARLLKLARTLPSTGGGVSYGSVWVNGYYRKDGTYVRGHYRSR